MFFFFIIFYFYLIFILFYISFEENTRRVKQIWRDWEISELGCMIGIPKRKYCIS